jgi:F-type H+-transporting ATPase subunit gamma
MRRANAIQKEIDEITTVEDLTGVFESIASTQVAKIKNKVQLSKDFFDLLWRRYSSLRVDPNTRIGNRNDDKDAKKVYVIISAEAGLSGDIDQRLIESMLEDYDPATTDLVVLGSHGANQLTQRGIRFIHHFQVPESDGFIDVTPVIEAISSYSQVTVYYEEYVSLGVQGIKKIDLISTIQEMSQSTDSTDDADEDIMTSADTIFEPSLDEIADQMEMIMMNLAFSQTILESQLAQDASRFNAMAVAKKRALELITDSKLEFHRSKRSESDRRLREVMVSLKKKKKTKTGKRR